VPGSRQARVRSVATIAVAAAGRHYLALRCRGDFISLGVELARKRIGADDHLFDGVAAKPDQRPAREEAAEISEDHEKVMCSFL
jgi:hypothetical protein